MLRILAACLLFPALGLMPTTLHSAEISAVQAYRNIDSHGDLNPDRSEQLVVNGNFNFDRLRERKDPVVIDNVEFRGMVDAGNRAIAYPVVIRNSQLSGFDATGATWAGDLVIESSRARAPLFGKTVFHGDFISRNSHYTGILDFSDTVFRQAFSLVGGTAQKARFSRTEFRGPAAFDGLNFENRALFASAIFEDRASFVETRSDAPIRFNRVNFNGDAEFRRSRFAELTFGEGVADRIVFNGLADFRKSSIDKLVFEQVDFNGDLNFYGAAFGSGGMRFTNVYFGGKNFHLEEISFAGPLTIESSFLPAIRFKWPEISAALLRSNPDTGVLNELRARSIELGRARDASRLEFLLADKARKSILNSVNSSFAEKLQAVVEYAVWGLPTGYGTRLDRILLIALALWLAGSLPLLFIQDKFYRVPAARDSSAEIQSFRFHPTIVHALPTAARQSRTFFERILVTLGFTFSLIFKLPFSIRYVEAENKTIGMHPTERYLVLLWGLGAYSLVLILITLAKTSPVISKIIGSLF